MQTHGHSVQPTGLSRPALQPCSPIGYTPGQQTLFVTDNEGATGSVSRNITVTDTTGNTPPEDPAPFSPARFATCASSAASWRACFCVAFKLS